MSRDDWYRRTTWSDTDRSEFQARLKRSRGDFHKSQYVRIQAGYLFGAGLVFPAIELLQQLFDEFPHESQLAQAHVQHAECLLALDRVDEAVTAYRAAFAAEQSYPNSRTQLWLDFPWLVVTRRLSHLYSDVDSFLDWGGRQITFPVDEFRLSTILSFLADDQGDSETAQRHAAIALSAAEKEHSGFRYHPTVGLVGKQDANVSERLLRLAGGTPKVID